MDQRKVLFHQTAMVAIGEGLGTAAMIGAFALVGEYDVFVLLGGSVGAALATTNYFLLSRFAYMAADKAEKQDVAGGRKIIQLSYVGRMIGMISVLVLCAKLGLHPLALVIPLVFAQPILYAAEVIKKRGGNAV